MKKSRRNLIRRTRLRRKSRKSRKCRRCKSIKKSKSYGRRRSRKSYKGGENKEALDKEALDIFIQIDKNEDKVIQDSELLTHLLAKGKTSEDINALFRALDINDDGGINEKEFKEGYEKYKKCIDNVTCSLQNVGDAVRAADRFKKEGASGART